MLPQRPRAHMGDVAHTPPPKFFVSLANNWRSALPLPPNAREGSNSCMYHKTSIEIEPDTNRRVAMTSPPARCKSQLPILPAFLRHLRQRVCQVLRQKLLNVIELDELVAAMAGEVNQHVGCSVRQQALGTWHVAIVPACEQKRFRHKAPLHASIEASTRGLINTPCLSTISIEARKTMQRDRSSVTVAMRSHCGRFSACALLQLHPSAHQHNLPSLTHLMCSQGTFSNL